MKPFSRSMLVALLWASFAFASSAAVESRNSLTVQPDGKCLLKAEQTTPRATVEQQLRVQQLYKNRATADQDDGATATPSQAEPKPFSDEELTKGIREMFESGQNSSGNLEALEVTKETVHMVMTNSYPSIKAMLQAETQAIRDSAFYYSNLRFEKDSDGHLRITFSPQSGMARYRKTLRTQWKLMGYRSELKLTLPGKVLSSSFSNIQDNATWYSVDFQKDENVDEFFKMTSAPVVIVAELGGLAIDKPIDWRSDRRNTRQNTEESDIPITEGTPGYTAEATSVTTSTIYYFPGGEKLANEDPSMLGIQKPELTVRTKLFAPKDRDMQVVSDIRVLKAVDDKGRPIARAETDGDDEVGSGSGYVRPGTQKTTSMIIDLRLPLPKPDAQSLQELNAEALVTTVGSWKELTLTNLQQTTNEIDLSEILPGAKLVITKHKLDKDTSNLEAELKGPAQIRQLKLQYKSSQRSSGSSSWDSAPSKKGDQYIRKVNVSAYHYGSTQDGEPEPPSLIVRYPQDTRRDRVQFKLTGLDLF